MNRNLTEDIHMASKYMKKIFNVTGKCKLK